jgi:hypothetical protein
MQNITDIKRNIKQNILRKNSQGIMIKVQISHVMQQNVIREK